jgi:hypothetical protein
MPDVIDVFVVSAEGTLWHRPFVVPPYVSDPDGQRYEIDYITYCCSQSPHTQSFCPCQP